MRDMIERIMEMDKTAREVTQIVQKEKITLEQEIKDLKKNIRSEYLLRAEIRQNTERVQVIKGEAVEDANKIKAKRNKTIRIIITTLPAILPNFPTKYFFIKGRKLIIDKNQRTIDITPSWVKIEPKKRINKNTTIT